MKPNAALALAVVFGLAAAGLVTYETLYGIEVFLEVPEEGGGWTAVAGWMDGRVGQSSGIPRGFDSSGCYGPSFRLRVDNHKPFAESLTVQVSYYNATLARRVPIIEDTWELGAFDVRTEPFDVPAGGYQTEEPERQPGQPYHPSDVQVWFGGIDYPVSACVRGPPS